MNKKQDPTLCCLQETDLKFMDIWVKGKDGKDTP